MTAKEEARYWEGSPWVEPGLLSAFRVFVGGTLGLVLLISIVRWVRRDFDFIIWWETHPFPYITVVFLLQHSFLLFYLSWKEGLRRLKTFYLPIALLVATLVPLLGFYWQIQHEPPMINKQNFLLVLPTFVSMFIPFLLVSWQYSFRTLSFYCFFSAGIELFVFSVNLEALGDTVIYAERVMHRFVVYMLLGYMISRLVQAQRNQRKALEKKNLQLHHYNESLEELAVSRERNRLARELHDTMAHHMSGMVLQLEGVKLLWDKDEGKAKEVLDQSIATTREGLQETRRALQALRATPLEDLGLAQALRVFAKELAENHSFSLELDLEVEGKSIPQNLEQQLYRIGQEALRNTAKHAEAKNVSLSLKQEDDAILFSICDDGEGFDLESLDLTLHFGLDGMRERARDIGGEMSIESQVDGGTSIQVRVPLKQERAEVIET